MIISTHHIETMLKILDFQNWILRELRKAEERLSGADCTYENVKLLGRVQGLQEALVALDEYLPIENGGGNV
jgi:hypothetical protein